MSLQLEREYQFLISIIGENDENSPYRIIDTPSMGIDLFFLMDTIILPVSLTNGAHTIVDMNIKARLIDFTKYNSYYYINISEFIRINLSACPFILTANACILNTPLRITNIGGYDQYNIDTIKLGITNLSSEPYIIRKNTTIAQLSHPALKLIKMKIVHPDDHIFHECHIESINNELFISNAASNVASITNAAGNVAITSNASSISNVAIVRNVASNVAIISNELNDIEEVIERIDNLNI
jgi:hypothetical protein